MAGHRKRFPDSGVFRRGEPRAGDRRHQGGADTSGERKAGRGKPAQGEGAQAASHPDAAKRAPAAGPKPERIFGRHSVRAIFLRRPRDVRRLLLSGSEEAHGEFADAATAAGIRPELLDPQDFLRAGAFTRDEKHQGVLVLAEPRRLYSERDFGRLEQARAVLALDQISNPQNLATMVRSAAFFGVAAILLLRDRSADVSAEVVRYAVGGAEFVDVFRITNLSQSLEALKDHGFFVVGLDERGEKTLAQTDFPEKVVLVVGAEDPGLRPKTKKYCDALVRIPGGQRGIESLNAGVATAIAMAEVFRNGHGLLPAGGQQTVALAGD